jgi:hypothetical protein
VIICAVGGSFARKHGSVGEPSADAARLARAVGRPVQMQWTFEEDLSFGIKRPPGHRVLRARLANGRVTDFESNAALAEGSTVFSAARHGFVAAAVGMRSSL